MRHYFTFNGIRSDEYGIYITGGAIYDAPVRSVEEITIPGRDGVLTIDNGRFEPISHVYEAYVHDSFDSNVQSFRNAIMAQRGHLRLTDTFHTDEFYLAYYEKGLEVDPCQTLRNGAFQVKFTRDPRRFLVSGETTTTLTANGSITNPTLFASKPLIRVTGTGTVGIGSHTVTITLANSYTDIDCEMMDAYKGTVNCNANIQLSGDEFPMLEPGANGITLGSGITKVVITPRWFRL